MTKRAWPSLLPWLLLLVAVVVGAGKAALADPVGVVHGLSPMPGGSAVPRAWLPPGSDTDADVGPSPAIFPPQRITLRFNHKLHVGDQGLSCKTCHVAATTSNSAQDRLLPAATVCDTCHFTDHSKLDAVKAGDGPEGDDPSPRGRAVKCAFCHNGYKDGDGNAVAPLVMPRANMVFSHQKHAVRNIACAQCHGAVDQLELSTRDQLPRMKGCFRCHQMSDAAARGEAKSDCVTCHVRAVAADPAAGRMKTVFASGVLQPPRWLHDAAHTPDFVRRHKWIAGDDSQFCSNCHKEDFCVGCHDGRVRPRDVHPGDYISMHPIEARLATQKCTSCHEEQSFCLGCHQRVGVSMSGPPSARDSGRFHPPKRVWSDAPRQPGHHSFEAERNLNACVSCHIERDCVVCHGGQGIGGGFDPHKAGFAGGCATQMRRNPRPCYVCHLPGEAVLAQCR